MLYVYVLYLHIFYSIDCLYVFVNTSTFVYYVTFCVHFHLICTMSRHDLDSLQLALCPHIHDSNGIAKNVCKLNHVMCAICRYWQRPLTSQRSLLLVSHYWLDISKKFDIYIALFACIYENVKIYLMMKCEKLQGRLVKNLSQKRIRYINKFL